MIEKAITEALLAGYRHIDCAWIYGNEKEIGRALREKIKDGIVRREDMVITTKLWNSFHHPDLVEKGCRDSMEKLCLDYIDIFLIHWPTSIDPRHGDNHGDIDYVDTWKAMESLVDKGLVRSIGISNFNSKQIQRILSMKNLKYKPVCNQIEVTPYLTNEKLIQFCKSKDIVVIAYSPLGGSITYFGRPKGAPFLPDDPVIHEISERYKKSPAQILLRWGIQKGHCVIPKSTTPSRIRENIQIFDFSLDKEDMESIDKLNRNYRYLTFDEGETDINYPFNEEY